jgi:protein-S-isoprenylcysteine O-methyltransferase Ste14
MARPIRSGKRMMLFRAIIAFVSLPGMVAFAIPLAIGFSTGRPVRHGIIAAIPLTLGTLLLLWCVREFYVAGRGTLAPWDPPKHLVTTGPYGVSRNPMYVGVLTILVGWCVLWDSRTLMIYAALFAIGFHLRVILFEEPWAARQFGALWGAYRARVSRWLL